MLTRELVRTILGQFSLAPDGEHGLAHWARVLENGRVLARRTGADLHVVELFAVLHDARRLTDDDDPLHGVRAAQLCAALRDRLPLSDASFRLLFMACALHVEGRTDGDITIQTCWDADRLDYARGGTPPNPYLLCTTVASDPAILTWATHRASAAVVPALIAEEWDLAPSALLVG